MTGTGRASRRIGPPSLVRFGDRLLGLVEDVIYVSVAALLAASATVVLYRAFIELFRSAQIDRPQALLTVLDELLLVFIFVELLYAVRTTLKERQVLVEPFLITGILASIKEIIVLSVKAANEYLGQGPEFARAMVGIGTLGVVVLVLAVSVILLRRGAPAGEEVSPRPIGEASTGISPIQPPPHSGETAPTDAAATTGAA